MNKKKFLLSLLSTTVILIVWKISALIIGADIILPPPEKVLYSLITVILSKNFIISFFNTLERGVTGFIISFISGTVVGLTAGTFSKFRVFISPLITIIRSTPVISVILLALIWFKSDNVPIFVSFLMAFPIVCGNIIKGVETVDKDLLTMAELYKIPLKQQVFEIYIPSIIPFIISAASLSLGIIWKVTVAAEVLSQPKWGIGTSLNEAKAYLITEEVFAWTVIAILLSSTTEFIFNIISEKILKEKYGYKA